MLSKEENDLLTRTGPGTPCGELLRRYIQTGSEPLHVVRDPARNRFPDLLVRDEVISGAAD